MTTRAIGHTHTHSLSISPPPSLPLSLSLYLHLCLVPSFPFIEWLKEGFLQPVYPQDFPCKRVMKNYISGSIGKILVKILDHFDGLILDQEPVHWLRAWHCDWPAQSCVHLSWGEAFRTLELTALPGSCEVGGVCEM